jgi:hypothetical protein
MFNVIWLYVKCDGFLFSFLPRLQYKISFILLFTINQCKCVSYYLDKCLADLVTWHHLVRTVGEDTDNK